VLASRNQWPRTVVLLILLSAGVAAGFYATLRYLNAPAVPERSPLFQEEFFSSGASGVKLLGSGWHQPENWGTWSNGPRATLSWTLDFEPLSSLQLKVEGRAFPVQVDRLQTIHVEVNGSHVGTMQSSVEGRLRNSSIEFPRSVAMRQAPMQIVFLIDRPTSPDELGAGRDRRKIGLGLSSVLLQY
jgi:hypothetical protein